MTGEILATAVTPTNKIFEVAGIWKSQVFFSFVIATMETSIQEKTPTSVSIESKAMATLNPDASPFTPSEPAQSLSPQLTAPAATAQQEQQQQQQQQPFKPHVKYCFYEQYGQCNKGDACPFAHRANEQCWYEANGGCRRGEACLFKHTGIKPTNDAVETATDEVVKNGEDKPTPEKANANTKEEPMATPVSATVSTVAPPIANKLPVVAQNAPPKKPAAPPLNTSMLEAKLNNAKKTVPSGPNATLNALGNALRPPVKTNSVVPGSAKKPVQQAAAVPVKPGSTANANANLSAKLALANANKTNQATTHTAKPASALRAAALASAKPGSKVTETKPVTAPTPASKPAATQQAQQAKGAAGKQPASPVASNKQTANKSSAAAAAGGGTLDNIKILTFEEIMAQKRAKKEAEKAAAAKSPTPLQRAQSLANRPSPNGGSPKPQPANVVKTAAPTKPAAAEKANNSSSTPTAPVASTPAVTPGSTNTIKKPANIKPANVAGQPSSQPANSTSNAPAGQLKKTNQPKASAQIATSQPKAANISTPVNNTAHIGTKRPAEVNSQAMPAAKKVAGEELKASPKPPANKPATATVSTLQAKAPAAVTPKVPTINKQISAEAAPKVMPKVTAAPEKVMAKRPLEAEEPISNKKPAIEKPAIVKPTSEQPQAIAKPAAAAEKSAIEKPSVPTESIEKKQEPSFDADDELAQFEAEFGGDLGELEGGDIQDFDEDSLMKELEELEQA